MVVTGRRLDFEIDATLETVTARAGVSSLIEVFRQTGTAAKIDEGVRIKTRNRGLSASRLVESLFALWASGGERSGDLDRPRGDEALAKLFSYDRATPRRYLAVRILRPRGDLPGSSGSVKHLSIVTNRSDSQGGSGLDIIRWHRGTAGTIKHARDVLMNELPGWALPSQKFGAKAASLRLNALLYNLFSAAKRVALPEELRNARPKRLRFLFINTIGRVVRHARETPYQPLSKLLRMGFSVENTAHTGLEDVMEKQWRSSSRVTAR